MSWSLAFSLDFNEEAIILDLVYLHIASTFRSTDPFSSTGDDHKNYRIYRHANALCNEGCHLKKNYQKMFNFETWFLYQFSSNVIFFLVEGLITPKNLENEKMKLQISILGGIKLKKREGGVFHRRTGLEIFVFLNAMIFAFTIFVKNTPLWGKCF